MPRRWRLTSGALASVCVAVLLATLAPEPSLAGARQVSRLGTNRQGYGLGDDQTVTRPGELSREDLLRRFRPEYFMVIGGGPAGLMAFILQYRLLVKLATELKSDSSQRLLPNVFATIRLNEKRFTLRKGRRVIGVDRPEESEFLPNYTRAQILRLDAHAVELLKDFTYETEVYSDLREGEVTRRAAGSSVYSLLFEGDSAPGYCLDEVKQPDVLEVGYDNVRFGKPAWLLDESTVYCHIQTKKLEEELYLFALSLLLHSRRSCADQRGPPCVKASMHFGFSWLEYHFDHDLKSYVSVFKNERYPLAPSITIPFDVLISAQGACSGSPGKCAISLRQQMMHPGGITLGTGSTRAAREADADKAVVGPDFEASWKPADDTLMSWGMTGFFRPGLLTDGSYGDDKNVLLTTWNSGYHITTYGGPVQVRSFVNRDVHYVGLGLPQSVVRKFDLDNPESEYARDNYFKFFELIFSDFESHPVLRKEDVLNPKLDKAHTPQLFPIVLFKSKDNTALLPVPEERRSQNMRSVSYRGRPAIVTFQGDEARLPNFVTASGINWGYYGLDRGMTNIKSGSCHGLYNFMKNFMRRHAESDHEGALRCLKESNADAAALSDSLAQRAQRLAEQFRHVSVPTAGGAVRYLSASKVQSDQLRELSQEYVASFNQCSPDHFTSPPRESDHQCSEGDITRLEEAALSPFLAQFNERETDGMEYTDCEAAPFCFKKAVERVFSKGPIPETLDGFTEEYLANVDTSVRVAGRRRSGLRLPSECQDFIANSARSLSLEPIYECMKKSRGLPWSPSGSESGSQIQPFETRREALILGCGEFSYFGCVSEEDFREASKAPTARVLPQWAADFRCGHMAKSPGDKYKMVCFNLVTGKNGGAYGWFNKDEARYQIETGQPVYRIHPLSSP